MQFHLLTIFPNIFDSYINASILKRAQNKMHISITVHDIRKYATDKHHTTDDRPYGGGPGMVMKVEPIVKTLASIKRKKKSKTFLLSPRGKTFDQSMAQRLTKINQLILICGHYEGVDERIKKYIDGEISIGNYILTGGELPALSMVDAVTRLLPGVLGDATSKLDETFSKTKDYIEYPHYTRPDTFKGQKVPKVLLSGDHKKIEDWRRGKSGHK